MKTYHYNYSETHCADCPFHVSQMVMHVRMGNNVYRHTCKHPTWSEWELRDGGRQIGKDDIVPDWCPLKTETKR